MNKTPYEICFIHTIFIEYIAEWNPNGPWAHKPGRAYLSSNSACLFLMAADNSLYRVIFKNYYEDNQINMVVRKRIMRVNYVYMEGQTHIEASCGTSHTQFYVTKYNFLFFL